MKILQKTLTLILFIVFSSALYSEGTFVLNAERAMLSTQYAKDSFKQLEEDSDFIADRERLELLQAEGQELIEQFQQDIETLSDEQKVDMQKKVQDKQNEIQFLANKLQTKAQEAQQAVINDLSEDKWLEQIVAPTSIIPVNASCLCTVSNILVLASTDK